MRDRNGSKKRPRTEDDQVTSDARSPDVLPAPTVGTVTRHGVDATHSYNAMTVDFKECSQCGLSKPKGEYYTKGDRVDAACKECVRSGKRKQRVNELADVAALRLGKVAKFIARHELRRLEHYHAQIREILERCEAKKQKLEENTTP